MYVFSSPSRPAAEPLAACVGCLVQKLRLQLLIWTEAHTRSPSPTDMMFPHRYHERKTLKLPLPPNLKLLCLHLTGQQQNLSSLSAHLKTWLKIQNTCLDLRAHTAHKSLRLASDRRLIVWNGFYYSEKARLAWYSVAFTYGAIYRALISSLVTRAKRQKQNERWILENSHIGSLVQARVKTNAQPFLTFTEIMEDIFRLSVSIYVSKKSSSTKYRVQLTDIFISYLSYYCFHFILFSLLPISIKWSLEGLKGIWLHTVSYGLCMWRIKSLESWVFFPVNHLVDISGLYTLWHVFGECKMEI